MLSTYCSNGNRVGIYANGYGGVYTQVLCENHSECQGAGGDFNLDIRDPTHYVTVPQMWQSPPDPVQSVLFEEEEKRREVMARVHEHYSKPNTSLIHLSLDDGLLLPAGFTYFADGQHVVNVSLNGVVTPRRLELIP